MNVQIFGIKVRNNEEYISITHVWSRGNQLELFIPLWTQSWVDNIFQREILFLSQTN